MKRQYLSKTKKGVTSLYVVVFATILFGVITLGFIRLIVSESSQSRDTELSQSAYDAAMAGVEDAKVATSQYYKCDKDTKGLFTGECAKYKNLFDGNCEDYKLAQAMYGIGVKNEIKIQETDDGTNETSTEQAYTCVIVKNTVADYRGTLDSASRVKVIPLKIDGKGSTVGEVIFSWYSEEKNGVNFSGLTHIDDVKNKYLMKSSQSTIPPSIALSLITIPANVDGATGALTVDPNVHNTNFYSLATVLGLPTAGVGLNPTLDRATLRKSVNSYYINEPFNVGCHVGSANGEYACQMTLQPNGCLLYGDETQDDGVSKCNVYLVASMPYGTVSTDFMVEMKDRFGQSMAFNDVQISVDSTGRANDLYRRVETRLSPSDDYFPYIQFELDLSGTDDGGSDSFNKNFWVTDNCWLTGRAEGENGKCANNSR